MKPALYAFDLDNTLSHFVGDHDDRFAIFTKHGCDLETVKAVWAQAVRTGFSVPVLCGELGLDEMIVKPHFDAWLERSLKLYDDAHDLPRPYAIVTFGNPEFQKEKIDRLGLTPDALELVDTTDGKPAALRRLLAQFGGPIIFVDDKAVELDRVRDAGITEDEVITRKINRHDSPYLNIPGKHEHEIVDDLNLE